MRNAVQQSWSRRPLRTGLQLLCLLGVIGVVLGQGATWIQWRQFDARLAALESFDARADSVATLSFDFRNDTVRLRIPYASASVRQAQAFDFTPAFAQRGRWRAPFLARAVQTESQTAFMHSFAAALQAERDRLGLDRDTYVELMACAVQNIPYGRVGAPLKTPLEVVASGSGVCTEKSVLLAALLAHEGYGAGVWSLYGHQHVGTAVRTAGPGFRNSGYAFIETTRPAYVGQLPGAYAGSGPVYARPQLVEIEQGDHIYGASEQVAYILWLRASAQRAAKGRAKSSYLTGPLAARSLDRSTAEKLVRWIDWNAHDRERVFERLTLAGSGRRDVLLGL